VTARAVLRMVWVVFLCLLVVAAALVVAVLWPANPGT
jgi:hypothetical protein